MALVTIAIPFYNAEKFLSDAIRSVINQSFTDWELLLIDDGSKDNSVALAKSFDDHRIKVFSDGINRGLVERLNQSIRMASGLYYARMDADDIMRCDRIQKQIEYLKANPNIDVVGSGYYSINAKNHIVSCCNLDFVLNRNHPRFLHPSALARTEWFKKNPYNPAYPRMEDYELWMRTGSRSKIVTLQKPLMFYREFGVPTYKKYIKSQQGILRLYSKYREYHIPFNTAIKEIFETISKVIIATFMQVAYQGDLSKLVSLRRTNTTQYNSYLAEQELQKAIS